MDSQLLAALRCPFCGGAFRTEALDRRGDVLRHGFLVCACDRYPVVASIPVLRKDVPVLLEEVVAELDAGRPQAAFLALVSHPLPARVAGLRWRRGRRLLRRLHQLRRRPHFAAIGPATDFGAGGAASTARLLAIYCENGVENFNYLAYRFAQPRHLVALSVLGLLAGSGRQLLDLGAGFGHLAFTLRQLPATTGVVGIDTLYFGLWVAKHRVSPEGAYVCCRADRPLPFTSGFFGGTLCADSFHYFVDKPQAFRELVRVTDGPMVLNGMHNREVQRDLQYGLPLSAQEYSALAGDLPHRMLADATVLARYLGGLGPNLETSSPPDELAAAPLLTMVASRRTEPFADHGRLLPPPHTLGPPSWNPLFARQRDGDRLRLDRRLPSAAFGADHPELLRYLPERLETSVAAEAEVASGAWSERLRGLAESFAVLGMPPGFTRDLPIH